MDVYRVHTWWRESNWTTQLKSRKIWPSHLSLPLQRHAPKTNITITAYSTLTCSTIFLREKREIREKEHTGSYSSFSMAQSTGALCSSHETQYTLRCNSLPVYTLPSSETHMIPYSDRHIGSLQILSPSETLPDPLLSPTSWRLCQYEHTKRNVTHNGNSVHTVHGTNEQHSWVNNGEMATPFQNLNLFKSNHFPFFILLFCEVESNFFANVTRCALNGWLLALNHPSYLLKKSSRIPLRLNSGS